MIGLIDAAIKGKNCSIIAYGNTGSGKTYTLTGGAEKVDGLGQLAIKEFHAQLLKKSSDYDITVGVYMVEEKKHKLYDLFAD